MLVVAAQKLNSQKACGKPNLLYQWYQHVKPNCHTATASTTGSAPFCSVRLSMMNALQPPFCWRSASRRSCCASACASVCEASRAEVANEGERARSSGSSSSDSLIGTGIAGRASPPAAR